MPTTDKKPTTRKTTTRKPAVRKTTHAKVATTAVKHAAPVHKPKAVKLNYIFAVGRRKLAVARVRWFPNDAPAMTVNGRPMTQYFPTHVLQHFVMQPLVLTQNDKVGNMTAKVNGGGVNGQAEAVRLGISRALVKQDPDLRLILKKAGFLRRDPRAKERKKYGLKRARRAPQWQKR
jgi:small subunit ribosomal protein S9